MFATETLEQLNFQEFIEFVRNMQCPKNWVKDFTYKVVPTYVCMYSHMYLKGFVSFMFEHSSLLRVRRYVRMY